MANKCFRGSTVRIIIRVDRWTITHGFFMGMGGFIFVQDGHKMYPVVFDTYTKPGEFEFRTCNRIETLKLDEFFVAPNETTSPREITSVSTLPHKRTISVDEINDRSKGDALAKILIIIQLSWFTIQIIA